MNCTFCMNPRTLQLCWSTLFWPTPAEGLCDACASGLEEVGRVRCPVCSKPGATGHCADCADDGRALASNRSAYVYNEQMKQMIYKWKYRGDYEVGNAFSGTMKKLFAEIDPIVRKKALIVPIPLSPQRLLERGFNQADMLAGFLPGEKRLLLERVHGEKQSKKSRRERLAGANPFHIAETVEKPVILVDDIYTTGTTVRHAAEVLKKAGSPFVASITLVRG